VRRTAAGAYIWSALVALAGAVVVMHLWHMRVGIPLYYSRGGEELMVLTLTKAMLDGGWYATISHLGAPFAMSTADFPLPDLLHTLVLRVITLVVHHAPVAVNLYFIAGFPLIALVSTYALRRLGVSSGAAVAMSVVYALLPFRFMRNEATLFASQYYVLPLLVLAVVWILREHALFDSATRRPTRDGYIFLVSLLALSWDNTYDAAFGVMLLAFAAAASYARTRAWRGVAAAVLGIVVIFAGVEIELLPSTIYQLQHGKDTAIVSLAPQTSEYTALTLAQLVLPIQNHRIPKLARVRAKFDSGLSDFINENSSATLGAVGALGFLGTLAALLLVRIERDGDLWPELSRLNLAMFFIATIGGVGALITYYFVPELDLYNRISPLIGFVSLVAVALVLDTIRRRWLADWNGVWAMGLALLMALAIFDQTSTSYVPAYEADLQAYSADTGFATILESRLGPNAQLYQLPHVPFPSIAPVERLQPWDQTALYLQSHTLHYSFGTTSGRAEDAWQLATNALPLHASLAELMLAGFDGVLVYTAGYADNGNAEISALSSQLGTDPVFRDDRTAALFDFSNLHARYVEAVGAENAAVIRRTIIHVRPGGIQHPPLEIAEAMGTADRLLDAASTPPATAIDVAFTSGCYAPERNAVSDWHWCGNTALLILQNHGQGQRILLKYTLTTGAPAHVTAMAQGKRETVDGSPQGNAVTEILLVPPGRSALRLTTSAQPIAAPADPRRLTMQIANLRVFQVHAGNVTPP
jgi:phosphoglycerol transferase